MMIKLTARTLSGTSMSANQKAYSEAVAKINEIIDEINKLKSSQDVGQDMIAKLCRFNDYENSPETVEYGILGKIDKNREDYPYYNYTDGTWYAYCEPVKPDDVEIMKGVEK